MLGGYCGKTVCHCILAWYMWSDNKRRDRVNGPADPVLAADNGMKGMTEIESKSSMRLLCCQLHPRQDADSFHHAL
jgi:hypothetical protein